MTIVDAQRVLSVTNAIMEAVHRNATILAGKGESLRRDVRQCVFKIAELEAAEHDQARVAWESEHSS